jgi:eukaryotic-like serine/threonine-protein kinase
MTGNLCMNCMSDTAGKNECPNCGFSSAEPQMNHALPYRTMLQNRYLIGRAKQSNGEGITYIGYDSVLNSSIELREFFPQTLCERANNSVDIRVVGGSEVIFDECLSGFLNYSREVAHMRELSTIVQIYDIFEENHTAYTVSEWDESITLRYFVERSGGSLSWNAARQLFMPVLSALSAIHAADIRHLGISPDTLHIMKDGKMKLGGFCISAVRHVDTDLPPDMVSGCAAIEQYVMDYVPNEATDVYGFAASLFFTLTGVMPQDALKRRTDSRLFIPTAILRGLPPHVVTAMANALQVSPDKRTPTFERLRAELSAAPTVTASLDETQRLDSFVPLSESNEGSPKKGVPNFVWVMLSCVLALIVFTLVGIIWISNSDPSGATTLASQTSQIDSSADSGADSLLDSAESSDPNLISVPNLISQNFDDLMNATSSMSSGEQDYQLLLSTKQFSDTIPEGCIISQSPTAGTKMARGMEIVVVVSQGMAVRTLPSIVGMSLSDASQAVTSAGFIPTKADAYSATVPAGTAIGYQKVKAGSQMAYGTQVVIVISKGPAPSTSSESISSSESSGESSGETSSVDTSAASSATQ